MAHPAWLKKPLVYSDDIIKTKALLKEHAVNTVCESSRCPNSNECFQKRFATFMILGDSCTRSCGFCSVSKKMPTAPDPDEPNRILAAVKGLGLGHVVITSVTRDDLPDGGASQFADAVKAIKEYSMNIVVELLIPDFSGMEDSIKKVAASGADVIGHNMETVKSLYPAARHGSDYNRSLGILLAIKKMNPYIFTKSGIMVGLGENGSEIVETMRDMATTGCDILTIGQYLRPGPENLEVKRYVTPGQFERYKEIAGKLGFSQVESGPFVRSSYLAEKSYIEALSKMEGSHGRCHSSAAC